MVYSRTAMEQKMKCCADWFRQSPPAAARLIETNASPAFDHHHAEALLRLNEDRREFDAYLGLLRRRGPSTPAYDQPYWR
jgi:hypothetical protein